MESDIKKITKTTKQVIQEFIEIHGNLYDYSLVNYCGNHSKVKIICSIHGIFEITPGNHRRGKNGIGCSICSKYRQNKNSAFTQEEVIQQFKEIHGDKYDYSLVEYINSHTKIKVICKIHGEFEQVPYSHKQGKGCDKCARKNQAILGGKKSAENRKLSITRSLKILNERHNYFYDYSNSIFNKSTTILDLICPLHGEFELSFDSHRKGTKCSECSLDNKKVNFIRKANSVHNNLFDYSSVNYKNSETKIKIICKEHGIFEQSPKSHLTGRGCLKCALNKKYKGIPTYLYYIRIQDQYKIGVTKRGNSTCSIRAIKKRYLNEIKKGIEIEIISTKLFEDGSEAYKMEQKIIKNNKSYLIKKDQMVLDSGYTETFFEDIS